MWLWALHPASAFSDQTEPFGRCFASFPEAIQVQKSPSDGYPTMQVCNLERPDFKLFDTITFCRDPNFSH